MPSSLFVIGGIALFGALVFNNLQVRSRLHKERELSHKRVKFLGSALMGRINRLL